VSGYTSNWELAGHLAFFIQARAASTSFGSGGPFLCRNKNPGRGARTIMEISGLLKICGAKLEELAKSKWQHREKLEAGYGLRDLKQQTQTKKVKVNPQRTPRQI